MLVYAQLHRVQRITIRVYAFETGHFTIDYVPYSSASTDEIRNEDVGH
jgi:hypothetical protein